MKPSDVEYLLEIKKKHYVREDTVCRDKNEV